MHTSETVHFNVLHQMIGSSSVQDPDLLSVGSRDSAPRRECGARIRSEGPGRTMRLVFPALK